MPLNQAKQISSNLFENKITYELFIYKLYVRPSNFVQTLLN